MSHVSPHHGSFTVPLAEHCGAFAPPGLPAPCAGSHACPGLFLWILRSFSHSVTQTCLFMSFQINAQHTRRPRQRQDDRNQRPRARLGQFNELYLLAGGGGSGGGGGGGGGGLISWRARAGAHSLNFHSCRHMGQCCCTCCAFSHFRMQCMWKQCEHWPHTSGQSSPGTLPARGQGQGQGHGGLTDSPGLARPRLRKASGGFGGPGAAQGAQWQGQCACLRLGHVTCDAKKAALSLSRCGAC